MQLIHKQGRLDRSEGSSIDTARAFLEELEDCKPLEGPLESAFPVHSGWLKGKQDRESVAIHDVTATVAHLDELWDALRAQYEIEPHRASNSRFREGMATLREERLAPIGSVSAEAPRQRFHLELRSQAAGDATLLRCRSPGRSSRSA